MNRGRVPTARRLINLCLKGVGRRRRKAPGQAPAFALTHMQRAGVSFPHPSSLSMDYLVSYAVWQNGLEYRQHFVSNTDDLGKNLRRIAGRRGLLRKLLREYKELGYVTLDFHNLDRRRSIKRITVREVPAKDLRVLARYLWK
jgi:lipocalin